MAVIIKRDHKYNIDALTIEVLKDLYRAFKYAITSEFNFIIRGTGIGLYCEIQCQDCLESADVSDYEHW